MGIADKLVLNRQRHLKWKALDNLEMILMIICGLTLFGFSMSVCADITTRIIGRPWLWLQEVTSTSVHLRNFHRRSGRHPPQ